MTAGNIRIRALATAADYAACLELQHLVWGSAGGEAVPPIVLFVSQKVGAIAAGAFDRRGRMLGCVFGFTGLRHGRLAHWSHMLAVRPAARDRGIGRRLKLYQRSRLRGMGVRVMYWTYDPLVARNAHLNLNRLGAEVDEYVVNLYGPGDQSPVDRVIGTDRCIVRWNLGPRVGRRGPPTFLERHAPVVNTALDADGRPFPWKSLLPAARVVRIEIPPDIHALRDRDPPAALAWRETTRRAFQHYLKHRCQVIGFYGEGANPRYFYVLSR